MTEADRVLDLARRQVEENFEDYPYARRSYGDHSHDGDMVPVDATMLARRITRGRALLAEVEGIDRTTLDAEAIADLETVRLRTENELFEIDVLRAPHSDPLWSIHLVADASGFVTRDYAPAADRALAMTRFLRQVPAALGALGSTLDQQLLAGPRDYGVAGLRGYGDFYRADALAALGDLPAEVRVGLERALEPAVAACLSLADDLEARPARPQEALGEELYLRYLAVSEGVIETTDGLLTRVENELTRLRLALRETVAEIEPNGDVAAAFERLSADHATADGMLDEARRGLVATRQFWQDHDLMRLPTSPCEVRATPSFHRWASAMFEPSGPLSDPQEIDFYYITMVQPDWSEQEAEEWLRHLNRHSLENIGVHEVYPGHYVMDERGAEITSPIRRLGFHPAHGEGWAHYVEELAIEQGMASGRPLLHLAQIQDALLRACRYRTAVGIHIEGRDVDWGIELFMRECHIDRFPAEREAQRATRDPLYLGYSYGKLEIQRWRQALVNGDVTLKRFHDTLLDGGQTPLAVAGARLASLLG